MRLEQKRITKDLFLMFILQKDRSMFQSRSDVQDHHEHQSDPWKKKHLKLFSTY